MSKHVHSKGAIFSIEGIEGAGKSTQAKLLKDFLESAGLKVLSPYEPGGTEVGLEIRAILKSSTSKKCPLTELLLFEASRAQLMHEISDHLSNGGVVVMDRFIDSTLAYQGYGRGIPLETIHSLNEMVTGGLVPDKTFILTLSVTESRLRLKDRGLVTDNFEALDNAFFERVAAGFTQIGENHPNKVLVDATRSQAWISAMIAESAYNVLAEKGLVHPDVIIHSDNGNGVDEVFTDISNILFDQLGVNRDIITHEAKLEEDLGADSLDHVEIVMAVEEKFGIEVPDEIASRLNTVQDFVTYVKSVS